MLDNSGCPPSTRHVSAGQPDECPPSVRAPLRPVVGALVGYQAISDRSPVRFGGAAITTAALTGLLGCATMGLSGALGVVVGLVAGGVTGWAFAHGPKAA